MQNRTNGKVFYKPADLWQMPFIRCCREKLFIVARIVVCFILFLALLNRNPGYTVAASETSSEPGISPVPTECVTPTVTASPTEGDEPSTNNDVAREYLENSLKEFTSTAEKIAEEDATELVLDSSASVFEKILFYMPYVGIGFFVLGAFIALLSIKNKANRRWGIRMAVVVPLVTFFIYIIITLIYDHYFRGVKVEELVRPEQLDYYGRIYFDVYEEVLNLEKLAGIADKMLTKNVLNILVHFYAENAMHVGIAVFGLGLLLCVLSRRNGVIRRWAGVCLCIIVPLILYLGYWYITRVVSMAG